MRKVLCTWIVVLCVAAFAAAQGGAATDDKLAGIWSGTWEGAGSDGGFELTLEKSKDGPLAGRVAVTGEPAYKATLKTLTFDGTKMTAQYDFPPDERAEIVLGATFEGNTAKGTWLVREKASGMQVANGTWVVTRK